jgi:plastocyanin domain-containing protein
MKTFRHAWWAVPAILLLFAANAAAAGKTEFTARMDPDGVQRAEIVAGSYFFDPNVIIVKVNVPVELKIRKEPGMVPHDVVLAAPNAGIDFRQELKETPVAIKFTPTRTGAYSFICDKKLLFFESHKDKGMIGTLEVRD